MQECMAQNHDPEAMLVNTMIFREYDIRGVAGRDLTDEVVYRLARSFGTYFRNQGVSKICLGRDVRLSSPGYRDIMRQGLVESGCHVLDIGLVPTPLVYYSQFIGEAEAGVMITGSHNPADNNGFKLCLRKGSVYGEQIQEIRRLAESGHWVEGSGSVEEKDLIPGYLEDLKSRLQLGPRKLKVVVDAGNGVGGITALPLYKALGCEVIETFCEPDGRFPNHHPDPTVPENLRQAIEASTREHADLVIALDGDADRIGVVDELGGILWGDQLMVLFSRELLSRHPGATIIAEVKCSQTLFDDIAKHGGQPIMSQVGHSLIKTKMKEIGSLLAGEMSGHLFFADRYFGFDDAVYSGARLMEILSRTDRPLSTLLEDLPKKISTPEIRVDCPDELKFSLVAGLREELQKTHEVITVDGVRVKFEHGWGLVRASNTQPVLVMRFEADTPEQLDSYRQLMESKVREVSLSLR